MFASPEDVPDFVHRIRAFALDDIPSEIQLEPDRH